MAETSARSWLRCYRCWSQDLEVQVHYEGIHKIDPDTGERAEVVDELQEAVVQCLDCMHDQPHLGFANGRVEPIEDRWERMIAGTPWVASCTVSVDAEDVESCSGPEAGDALSYAAFGDHGVREFFTHVRFHKHEDDASIIVHLLVELYARSLEEATEVLESSARGLLTITSLAEESRPPAAAGETHGRTTSPGALRARRAARSAPPAGCSNFARYSRNCGSWVFHSSTSTRSSSAMSSSETSTPRVSMPSRADRRDQADRGLGRRAVAGAAREHPATARASSRRSPATGSARPRPCGTS